MITLKRFNLFLAIVILLFSSFFAINASGTSSYYEDSVELIYQVEDWQEAVLISELFDLELVKISSRGIAVFKTTFTSNMEVLLANGFALNSKSNVNRPPWQRTGDPYLNDQYALEMMETIAAWDVTVGSSNVVVAIIDTGIDINHDEFINRISLLSYNAETEVVGLEAVVDDHGHGTMVAGIIGAIKDNGKGIAGIAQNISLLIIKANEANQGVFRDSALIEGIYYAVEQGADIINLSLGGSYLNPLTKAALDYAYEQGVLVIAAAGNNGSNSLFYPAAFESTLSISAVNSDRTIASYSNYGTTIDLSAPGTSIVTTARNNGYATASGTSFAAPQVAGLVALMLSYHSELSLDEIIFRLFNTAMDEGEPGWDEYFGHGIVNTLNALTVEFVKVSFETFEGSSIDAIYVPKGLSFELPSNPILADHIFDGWYKDGNFVDAWNETIDVPLEDLILYAKYNSAFHTVHFVTAGSSIAPLVVAHGEYFDVPESELEHYIFEGWAIDEARTIPYISQPLNSDLTLYAIFTPIIYYQVDLIVDGLLYDSFHLAEGELLYGGSFQKTGYLFDGWYLDAGFNTPYYPIEIYNDIELFARFIPITYLITFVTSGSYVEPLEVPYGELFTLPITVKEDYTFIDWYLDENYTLLYVSNVVTEDLTLYARFASEVYSVSYMIGDELYAVKITESGYPLEPFVVSKFGYSFVGWYYDYDLTIPYNNELIDRDLSLYAAYELLLFSVIYYNFEGEILLEIVVGEGESVNPPLEPLKPSTPSFHYYFVTWSDVSTYVENDLEIYPIYEREFRFESVTLNPGVDTIEASSTWNDSSITLLDESLEVVTTHNINYHQLGKYQVVYSIYDGDELIRQIVRIIRVIEAEVEVQIVLNASLTTIVVGTNYVDAGATSNVGTIEVISNVDITRVGTYTVIYRVETEGSITEKTRYVHVISAQSNTLMLYPYQAKKEGEDYVA